MIIRDFIQDVRDEPMLQLVVFLIVLMVAATFGLLYYENKAATEEKEAWDRFSKEHNCKIISQTTASVTTAVGNSISPNGSVGVVIAPVVIPSKTGYLCDDGVTYYRKGSKQ